MNFFFDYTYYRVTQLMFKRDGRTGGTAIVLICLSQSFIIALAIEPLFRYVISKEVMYEYAKQYSYAIVAVYLILFFINYRKYNGTYNKYRYHWKDETKSTRLLKGLLVILSLFFPMLVFIILGIK